MCATPSPDLETVLALERELRTPVCRADEQRVRTLLAPDFIHIGASGRRYDLASLLDFMRLEAPDDTAGTIEVAKI